jgi:hypothetical protein
MTALPQDILHCIGNTSLVPLHSIVPRNGSRILQLSGQLLCRFPLVVLRQASQSFSTPHGSQVLPCLRPRRKQDPMVFALRVNLGVADDGPGT